MTTRLLLAGLAAAAGTALSLAQPPALIPPAEPGSLQPMVAMVASAQAPANPSAAYLQHLGEARTAYTKLRDYSGHFVRQELVGGKLLPEQTGEIRGRIEPASVCIKLIAPKAVNGMEASTIANKWDGKIRFKPAGATSSFVTVAADDKLAMSASRHTIKDTGIAAILTHLEKQLEVEKKAANPVQVFAQEYTFNDRPAMRFEIFTERPHPHRSAHKTVVYFDKQTKLPVRFEAYDQPKGAVPGDLLETISFMNLKFNSGLGDGVFEK